MYRVLIVGASSAIATATIAGFIAKYGATGVELHCVSSQLLALDAPVVAYLSDYSAPSVEALAEHFVANGLIFDAVLFFNGRLHLKDTMPEKKVAQFDPAYLLSLTQSNVLPHMLWFAHLHKVLGKSQQSKVIVLSARIGSIGDNRSGGWYSYRMSKAMLNMACQCYAIELARTHPLAKMILFHPGTTDTPLSRPFQKNVPADKLFTPQFVAEKILSLVARPFNGTQLEFIDWQEQPIAW
ncbi:hypothetical protein ACFOEE_01710 [Pseudoalteromonas fenneropenaei]|uniref:SDR family NAD(P)-dependent oxidoreductase n=1 Tax=Pseudoalteromonas fenneropenaei TaxID=1737459 RepID=A0ABV7CF84_9GAMM